MLDRSNGLILALALAAAVAGGYLAQRSPPPPANPAGGDSAWIGRSAPPLNLPDLEGKRHALNAYRGRRIVLNFWASWCRPCLQEMPALVRAQQNFGENEPIVLGIAMDDADHVRAYLAAHPVNYPILLGDTSAPSTAQKLGDTQGLLPYSVLLGADGRILATHRGALTDAQLQRWLATPGSPP